jgi:hypothetical protein
MSVSMLMLTHCSRLAVQIRSPLSVHRSPHAAAPPPSMSFSGKQKKAALQEKRERDRLRAEQETAREKARLAAEDAARERKRQEELTGGAAASSTAASVSTPSSHAAAAADDDDDDVGIRPVRRNVAVAQPGVHATAAPPPPVSDEDDVGGIVPVRRNNKGVTAKSAAATSSSSSAPAPAAASVASGSTSVPSTINALTASAHTKTLRTAFARESDELIEARKKAAREPLKRDHLSSDGGTESVDYYSREEIAIPMRPDWHGKTPAQLEADEAKYFNDWLERIYQTYGQDRLNHYEHNLEVWRQLWRVCERSDILLVIVDSRQPILNFPPSLYHYITQTLKKPMILVLNKIDLIPNEVVNEWITYFHRRYPSLHVIPFTSFPAERRDTLDHLKKSKVKRGRGMTLVKPYGAEDLLRACQQIVQDKNQLRGNVPEEVRKAFNFDPTLLSGGVHAVEKTEQMYAGADEYMRTGDNDDGEDDIGASSLSKELKQMGVLKKHKADQRRKAKAEKLRLANEALMPSSEDEDASEDESEAESSSSKKKDKHKKRGSKKKQSRVRMGATDDVHEYNQDAEEVDSADEADASIVAANTRAFSGVLGQLEDVRSAEQEEEARARVTEFITLGCLGQPNAGSVWSRDCDANACRVKRVLMVCFPLLVQHPQEKQLDQRPRREKARVGVEDSWAHEVPADALLE